MARTMSTNDKELFNKAVAGAAAILTDTGIVVNEANSELIIPLIASTFIEQLLVKTSEEAKSGDGTASLEFDKLFTIKVSNRESNEGEKDGNIMVTIVPGPKAKMTTKDDGSSEGDDE